MEEAVKETPPSYYAPIQAQLDRRCESLNKKIFWLFSSLILCSISAYGVLIYHIQDSEVISVSTWVLCFHFTGLIVLCIFGCVSARQQSHKNFKLILCFSLYLAIAGPCHRFLQLFDSALDARDGVEDLLALHLTDNLSLLFTLFSWTTFIPVYVLHSAFKQAKYFGQTGILMFPEGSYSNST